jgi:hypothetical protein
MGSVADSIAVKILIGVATAAVWFMLSRAANAAPGFAGTFAADHAQAWTVSDGGRQREAAL